MNITNKFNLPNPIVKALTSDRYEKEGDYSATQIIGPPRISELRNRHDDEIEIDASDNVWMLLGHAIHEVIGRIDEEDYIKEKSFVIKVGDKTVSGRPDLYSISNLILDDFKATSVWSFTHGVKTEWVAQVNIYAHMLRKFGHEVREARIIAILRDWMVTKVHDHGYPQCPIHCINVPLWPDETVAQYIEKRVLIHQIAGNQDDENLPECTPEERWEKPTRWAVIKKGKKRAVNGGVFENSSDANAFWNEKGVGSHDLVERPGESTRCKSYCNVAPFCPFAQAMQ